MSVALSERFHALLMPPRFLMLPSSGIALSDGGIKAVRLSRGVRGLVLAGYADIRLPSGAYVDGEIVHQSAIVEALSAVASAAGVSAAAVSIPEKYITATVETDQIVSDTLSVFDQAGIRVRSIEGELSAMTRALLSEGDSGILLIDIGRTTTKAAVIVGGIPQFPVTIAVGGHAFTLAVQKHFGITEAEARRVKVERGMTSALEDDDCRAAMRDAASAIREEVKRYVERWEQKAAREGIREPLTRGVLVGGNASVRGLLDYLESALRIPIVPGDVFFNLAPRDEWVPPLDYAESLAYAAAIGLALRDQA